MKTSTRSLSPTGRRRLAQKWGDLRLATRLHLLNAISILGLLAICAYSGYSMRTSLMAEREDALSQMMDAATHAAQHYVQLATDGQMSRQQAQQQALATLRQMRYGKDSYFFANEVLDDRRMRRLMHGGDDKLVDTIADGDADAEFVRLVRSQGGGTIELLFPRPGSPEPVAKINEVRGIPEWNWIIGSGIYIDDVQAAFWKQMLRLGGMFALIWALLSGVSWLITRSITRPLQRATQITSDIAAGRFGNAIGDTARDEVGQLLHNMDRMQQQLKAVTEAQLEMARQHDAGMISFRMDETRFPGEYGQLVRETNAFVGSHVAMEMHLLDIMGRYAVGDLAPDLERYPGEKAALTRTMDTVKHNLQAINAEIKRLAQAAAAGDFAVRGDAGRFEHDFAAMVVDLNAMMDVSDANLGKLSALLGAIADGDLRARMEGEFQGVFAQMRNDANATVQRLTGIVGRIQQASGAIDTAATEIAAGNEDLSRRTEQQAANLEETAASMEELTSTVRQNAESARQANQLAQGAAGVAQQGGEVVGQVVTTMSAIETSSKKIAEIISVIDGIAFQTNILALNAAVEAARAGEQGRGFAVVASEVRTLAQRSANAAKEIKGLIDDSVGKVADGSALVHEAGKTMGEIVTSVQRVTDIMAEISAASQEQSAGIEQVNQTVTQMDETTQQNAALVEEATAAARAMAEQASQLSETVSVFRLQAGPVPAEPPLRLAATA
ncbi:methyl-accepting chemotaxis protein [Stenotrophomonas sp. MMGLT7]|uniref:methyl-accepting chemotaxis protein n=1 Tax=Stenotrophomonas sp. MMGLT7 TaxID=2901227 RepID=UPI001E2A7987|nr:methyl-accepting chemotaxis protein [Stenotrophomonas sp. MMGLT7]MCD7098602.1 methyl-accepting chemotaxis protein [Stenotrophomonas sp. MMGLT7]